MMKKFIFTTILAIISISLFSQTDILAPELDKPADAATGQMPDVELDWYPVSGTGVITYEVNVDVNNQFPDPEMFETTVSAVETEDLLFGQLYFWKVRAINETDTSDWSETYSFTVFKRVLLDEPDNGAVDQMPDAVLSRKQSLSGGLTYSGFDILQCQIDTSYGWSSENIDLTEDDLNSAFFIDEANGWIIGESGTILAYDDGLWRADTIYYNNSDTIINTGLNSIHNGFIVGNEGTFLYYENDQWILDSIQIEASNKSLFEDDLYSVFAFSSENIWAVGINGNILHKGTSQYWEVNNTVTDDLYSLFFVDENNGWAVGKDGLTLYYNGTEWTEQTSPVTKDLNSVYFSDMNHGWTCGKSGKMAFYDGNEWTEIESNTNQDLNAICMINPDEGWATGIDGIFVEFDGVEWFETTIGTLNTLNSIFVLDSENAWISGAAGTIITKSGDGFNSPLMQIISTIADSSNVHTENLLFGTKYYWRFSAIHDGDTSSWSSVRFFNTIDGVNPLTPEQDAINQHPDVELTWDEISGVGKYIYQLCSDSAFTFPCLTGFTEMNSAIIPDLSFGETYYWRVKAGHAVDTTAWSDKRNFEVINTVLLTNPVNGDTAAGILPLFVWNEVVGVYNYELQIFNNDLTYTDTVFVDSASSFKSYKPLEIGKEYSWKARAMKNGEITNWSETWDFYTELPEGINDLLLTEDIHIYPNPSTGKLNIELMVTEQTDIQFSLTDLTGKLLIKGVYTLGQGLNTKTIDLQKLNNGIYILKLQTGKNYYSEKIIIEN